MAQLLHVLCAICRLLDADDAPLLAELHAGLVELCLGGSAMPCHARLAMQAPAATAAMTRGCAGCVMHSARSQQRQHRRPHPAHALLPPPPLS
jgi:hypothetical protein